MLPQFLRDLLLDQAIAPIQVTAAEREQFRQRLQHDRAYQAWLQQQDVTTAQFEAWLSRELKIRKFQQARWGKKLNSYFLQRKHQLDRVVCSLIYLRDKEVAQELYFRIVEGEQPFADLARCYSQGSEAQAGGRLGPIALGDLHPGLAQLFYGGRPGQLWKPTPIGEWVVIARLEEWLPVQLDEAMRQSLFGELLEAWLQDQYQQQFPAK